MKFALKKRIFILSAVFILSYFLILNPLQNLLNLNLTSTVEAEEVVESESPKVVTNFKSTKKEIISIFETPILSPSSKSFGILSLINGPESYGTDRNFSSYLSLLVLQNYSSPNTSTTYLPDLNLLVSSKKELDSIKDHLLQLHLGHIFGQIKLVYFDFEDAGVDRTQRHYAHFQRERRKRLSVLRNQLLLATMKQEWIGVVWMDVDVFEIESAFMFVTLLETGLDVVTPNCLWGTSDYTFDQNTWVGERMKPASEEQALDFVPGGKGHQFSYPQDFRGQEFVRMDSVGASVLYIASHVYQSGVLFPPYHVIGTVWERPNGWDAVESEGLCFVARNLGFECWAMPDLIIRHIYEGQYQ